MKQNFWSIQKIKDYPIFFIEGKPLHSIHNPMREGNLLLKEVNKNYPVYILVGIGCGYVLGAFQDIPNVNIIILFQDAIEKELFEQNKIYDIHTKDYLVSDTSWRSLLFSIPSSDINLWLNPVYLKLTQHTPQIKKNIAEIQLFLKQKAMNTITDAIFGRIWWKNFLHNYAQKKIFIWEPPSSISNKPILLIGSGYSTYESIEHIKQYKNSFYIIAVPPILDLLIKHNIIPDLVIISDGGPANRFYLSICKLPKSTSIICYPHIHPVLLRKFKGNIYLVNSGLEIESYLTPGLTYIASGGSVASTALEIACLYSQNITYTGFDFSYTNLHPHYPGSPLESNLIFHTNRLITLENKLAKKVYLESMVYNSKYTTLVLKSYSEYFSRQIEGFLQQGYSIKEFSLDNILENGTDSSVVVNGMQFSTLDRYNNGKKILLLLEENINSKDYNNPVWTILISQAQLKKKDIGEVLIKEKDFLIEILESIKKL